MQILVKIAFILLPLLASAQTSFYKRYADNNYDFGHGVVQLEDSSYVVVGTSGSFAGHAQSFLMQVDSLGNKLWSNHYGGQESDGGRRVLYQQNFGFYMCGHSNSFGAGDYDFYLVKVNASGVEEWSRTYGDSDWERLMDATMTRDTGTVLVGEKENGIFGADMFIVRTDINGDTLWTKTLTNMGDDIATSVDVYQDSILYVGGTIFHADSSQSKGIIYKMLDTGEMLDTLLFHAYAGEYALNDLHVIGDTVQALGSNRRDAADEWDYTFYRSDLTVNGFGNISCFNSNVAGDWYGDVFTSYGANAKRYMGMSFEGTPTTMANGRDIHVQRGNTFMFYDENVAFLNFDEPDVNGEMIRTNDGGAMLVGYHQNLLIGSGGGTVFLLKIGANETYPMIDNVLSEAIVYLSEAFKVLDISVYPNPADNWLRIELPTDAPAKYQLTQISGQQVVSGIIQTTSTIDTSNLPSGVYLLEVSTDQGRAVNRVVIQ